MEAMTLEMVRDRIDKLAGQNKVYASVHVAELTEWMIALDAHLDKPAQAVDVGTIDSIASDLQEYAEGCHADYLKGLVQRLRALSGEKAGPVDGRSTHNVYRYSSTGVDYEEIPCYCGADRNHPIGQEVPASPTPGKEGQP